MSKERMLFIVLLLILTGLGWSFINDSLLIPSAFLLVGFILLIIAMLKK